MSITRRLMSMQRQCHSMARPSDDHPNSGISFKREAAGDDLRPASRSKLYRSMLHTPGRESHLLIPCRDATYMPYHPLATPGLHMIGLHGMACRPACDTCPMAFPCSHKDDDVLRPPPPPPSFEGTGIGSQFANRPPFELATCSLMLHPRGHRIDLVSCGRALPQFLPFVTPLKH
ncbi:hypothetical protein K431DRAFT_125091 [Polychaeton citri CBS 116435]|uniref:Uncharacterized protein n=1 Tax=Polychaeton citri CBS 116435 TaxID=1314669 RepID=A0A9P4ULS9_9PEZI|nr:hypothetical protein K431DRAFT_125091 [Polychaeton citri CBS 116435]